jgi:hypothetical protein
MNDLKPLEELGRALDAPAATPPGRLRHRVLTEATRPARGRPRPAFPRFGWRLATVGGLAAALTIGVLASQVVSFDERAPVSTASAAERVLAGAADQARHRPALPVRADQFIYVESRAASLVVHEGGSEPAVISRELRRAWHSADGTRDGLIRTEGGIPSGERRLPGCQNGTSTVSEKGKTEQVECSPLPGYRADLPTDPDGMLTYLYRGADGTKNPRDQEAFTAAADLIQEAYLSPASLAAVFEAVARIPGVRVVGDVTDAAGRAGVALARDEVQGTRAELIFDRRTNAYLGKHEVLTRDAYGRKAGESVNSTAVLTVAVVDRAGQLP